MIGTMLTIAEAAEQLHVSRQRMHQIIEENNLQTVKVHERLLVIHPRELKKIKEKRSPGRPRKN